MKYTSQLEIVMELHTKFCSTLKLFPLICHHFFTQSLLLIHQVNLAYAAKKEKKSKGVLC
jgi:hypothetical protein